MTLKIITGYQLLVYSVSITADWLTFAFILRLSVKSGNLKSLRETLSLLKPIICEPFHGSCRVIGYLPDILAARPALIQSLLWIVSLVLRGET